MKKNQVKIYEKIYQSLKRKKDFLVAYLKISVAIAKIKTKRLWIEYRIFCDTQEKARHTRYEQRKMNARMRYFMYWNEWKKYRANRGKF